MIDLENHKNCVRLKYNNTLKECINEYTIGEQVKSITLKPNHQEKVMVIFNYTITFYSKLRVKRRIISTSKEFEKSDKIEYAAFFMEYFAFLIAPDAPEHKNKTMKAVRFPILKTFDITNVSVLEEMLKGVENNIKENFGLNVYKEHLKNKTPHYWDIL